MFNILFRFKLRGAGPQLALGLVSIVHQVTVMSAASLGHTDCLGETCMYAYLAT